MDHGFFGWCEFRLALGHFILGNALPQEACIGTSRHDGWPSSPPPFMSLTNLRSSPFPVIVLAVTVETHGLEDGADISLEGESGFMRRFTTKDGEVETNDAYQRPGKHVCLR